MSLKYEPSSTPAFRRVGRMQYGRVLRNAGIGLTPELGPPPVSMGVVYELVNSELFNSELVDVELVNYELVNSDLVHSELVNSGGQGRCCQGLVTCCHSRSASSA